MSTYPSLSENHSTNVAPAPTYHPVAPPPSTFWIPLHEAAEAWADFGAEAISSPAFVATGEAFIALSWETSAARHHGEAWQAQLGGRSRSARRYLQKTIDALHNAVSSWDRVLIWLERLANNRRLCETEEALEEVRSMIHQASTHQQRIWNLIKEVEYETATGGIGHASSPGDEEQHCGNSLASLSLITRREEGRES